MTTTIHIHKSHTHEGTKVQIIGRDQSTGAETILADDPASFSLFTGHVWDGREIVVREVKKEV